MLHFEELNVLHFPNLTGNNSCISVRFRDGAITVYPSDCWTPRQGSGLNKECIVTLSLVSRFLNSHEDTEMVYVNLYSI